MGSARHAAVVPKGQLAFATMRTQAGIANIGVRSSS
jgi:hypothetical protein